MRLFPYFSHLNSDDLSLWYMTSDLMIQVWFHSDFKFSNEVNFTFYTHLTMWSLMTFDLGIWPFDLMSMWDFYIISINQVWFQSEWYQMEHSSKRYKNAFLINKNILKNNKWKKQQQQLRVRKKTPNNQRNKMML